MKKITAIIFALCIMTSASVFAKTMEFTPENRVHVMGTANDGEAITLMLIDKDITDITTLDKENIGYVEQTVANNDNIYSFDFTFTENMNDYQVLIGKDGEIINESIELAQTRLQAVSANVSLSGLYDEQDINTAYISSDIENYFLHDIPYKLILAFFDDSDKLISVARANSGTLELGKNTYKGSTEIPQGTALVKGFVWTENNAPMCQSIKIFNDNREFNRSELTKHTISSIADGSNVVDGILDAQDISTLVNYDEVETASRKARGGLPNFRYKLNETNETLHVVFLGGSITANTGYRDKISDWLVAEYGDRFEFTNAGIGGTGSGLGNARYGVDVLSKNPDLVFVEFAVNDFDNPHASAKGIESIVRQQWGVDSTCDIMLLYTVHEKGLETAQAGKWTNCAKAQDYVANYYGIPSVFMGATAVELAKDETELIWNKGATITNDENPPCFSPDGIHPKQYGSQLYFEETRPLLEEMLSSTFVGNFPTENLTYLSKESALSIKNYSPANYVDESFVRADSVDSIMPKGFRNIAYRSEEIYYADDSGDSVSFTFTGTQAGMLIMSGPDAPCIDIIIDGKLKSEGANVFLPYMGPVGYMPTTISTGQLPYGKHTVTFKISEIKYDKLARLEEMGASFASMADTIRNNPDLFANTRLVIGAVYVNGEIVK